MRYQRQISLPEISEVGQKYLNQSKVLIVGAGGLGHPALQYLVCMGIGEIGLVDGDVVAESNLHRQVLFSEHDIGKNKAECLKHLFDERRDPCVVKAFPFFLTKKSAFEIFPNYDVIVDGSDNFQTKFLINDVCCVLNKPMVYGSISQFEGQIATFWKSKGPCYRCLIPEIPKSKIQNCADAGVVGVLPAVVGSMQALEVMKIIFLMREHKTRLDSLVGKLMSMDLASNLWNTFRLSVKKNCKCHSDEFTVDSIIESGFLPATCAREIAGIILDVREQEEWDQFHVPSIVHWPLSKMELGLFPVHLKEELVTAVCKSGIRAEAACKILKEKGFKINFTKQSIYGIETGKA